MHRSPNSLIPTPTTMKTEKRYKHPKVALCRRCGGLGFLSHLDEFEEEEITEVCPDCEGSGRMTLLRKQRYIKEDSLNYSPFYML